MNILRTILILFCGFLSFSEAGQGSSSPPKPQQPAPAAKPESGTSGSDSESEPGKNSGSEGSAPKEGSATGVRGQSSFMAVSAISALTLTGLCVAL